MTLQPQGQLLLLRITTSIGAGLTINFQLEYILEVKLS